MHEVVKSTNKKKEKRHDEVDLKPWYIIRLNSLQQTKFEYVHTLTHTHNRKITLDLHKIIEFMSECCIHIKEQKKIKNNNTFKSSSPPSNLNRESNNNNNNSLINR